MAEDPYASLAQRFVDHYETLRGAVRFALLSRQLDEHLPPASLQLVDVGGGAGHQAIRLARAGHQVTLVDPSAAMLDHARAAIEAEPTAIRTRLKLVHASAAEASNELGRRRFDVVLCHAVLPYVEDPKALIVTLGKLTRPGGLVSLVVKNADALAIRPALEGRWADVVGAFDATEDVGGLGVATRAHRRADVESWLAAVGLEVSAWYGIRALTDHLTDRPPSDLSTVLPAEIEASHRDPYRALGRLIHFLATAPDEQPALAS